MGFALLAYFQANPQFLPDGQTLQKSADQLFPRYIVFGLPQGITGLVVAGLLAAAMSSLSSGVNSTATVIQVDFVERFSRASGSGRRCRARAAPGAGNSLGHPSRHLL
jgi:SSS family solute:Na+ symporter